MNKTLSVTMVSLEMLEHFFKLCEDPYTVGTGVEFSFHSLWLRLGRLPHLALFDMPNLNRFDISSISIFCKIALSISIFSKITISISIFLELPYRYRYFSELPYRYRYRYRYFQHLHIDIDIDIDIFQKCRYIDNRYVISIYRTGLRRSESAK